MRRALPISAAAFAGTTLLFLIAQAIFSKPQPVETRSPTPEQVAEAEPQATIENEIEAAPREADPAIRMAEIAQLREARGTVLAGTILAGAESSDDFNVALAQFIGTEPLPTISGKAEVVRLLRRTAQQLDAHAHQYEEKSVYPMADVLRADACVIRKMARKLEEAHETGESPFGFEYSRH